jgi:hypothetical protein
MSNTTDKPVCHRADDILAFLYDEASGTEAADFANHMNTCAACRTEFTLLTGVRESMSQWRSEVLGSTWRVEPVTAVDSRRSLKAEPGRHLSAIAALREFFAISPLWLRGATAMAAVLFCLLVTLFGARMLRTPEKLYTQDEVTAQVQRQLDQLQKESQRAAAVSKKAVSDQVADEGGSSQNASTSSTETPPRQKVATKSSRRFLSREEREQLAADLRLKPTTDDEDLTFLLDGGSK